MMVLSPAAQRLLLSAVHDDDVWFINRTLGYKTWRTRGAQWNRPDIAELYRNGLVEEWFSPWTAPCCLTPRGVEEFTRLKPPA